MQGTQYATKRSILCRRAFFGSTVRFPRAFKTVTLSIGITRFCLRRSRRKHLCRNSDTLYLVVYLYNILLA